MKLAITGKGGVGKTTLSAVLCHLYAREGRKVLAVDADPDANLAQALGLSAEEAASLKPISELTDLITERTGARPGSMGGVFRLNPRVDDIPEQYGKRINGILLLVMGKAKETSSGCYCPENVFLRRLLRHIVVDRDEVVVVDMEAGIEHLTRGTAEAVDAFVVVVEPGQRSIQTAMTIKKMAQTMGVRHIYAVANKITSQEALSFIEDNLKGHVPLLGSLSYDQKIIEADLRGVPPFKISQALVSEVEQIKQALQRIYQNDKEGS